MSPRSIAVPSTNASPDWPGKLEARGKFFFSGADKVLLKGVTYGPFAPDGLGTQFPDWDTMARDLDLITELGANTLRTFTVPHRFVLDLAANRGVRVLVGIPWAEHVCFLDSKKVMAGIRRSVADAVKACARHDAVAAYMVGNEIPPDIVRWYGAPRVAAFLRELVCMVKDIDPETLVGYANFPSTEYLETEFTDFFAFNVYLHREPDFRRYLYRLHSLAGNRPVVLTEFGIDSMREGADAQAETLSWQVRTALEMGAAGTCVFSFTDEWFTGGHDVRDWAFGVVDRQRRPKPAFRAVKRWYASDGLPALPEYPKVSVVICAYNAENTMAACLDSLRALRYPATEVVVVDDGSTDRTGAIADGYEGFHVIHQENKGLSAARNVGMAASTGDIIAYTDSDCVVDPDWLHYLVATFLSSGLSAVGGPNLPPPEDSFVASCVAASPGGPLEVLLDDEEAEHIPGCNMAFRREVLEEIGGFDPVYRAAGDDVDVCWRLQNRGYRIGWSPAAMVWHFRRNTVKAYIGQQRGYGKAEALLYFRHPRRFNALGYARWRGRIYGGVSSILSLARPVVYGGVYGRGLFQTLYQPPSSLIAHLPFTLEWNAVALALLVYAIAHGGHAWLGVLPLGLTWAACLAAALRAPVDARGAGVRGRIAHRHVDLPRASLALSRAVPVVGARSVSGGPCRRGLGSAAPCRVLAGARIFRLVLDREWSREGVDPRRSPDGGGGAQVLRRGRRGMEHVGPRGAGGALVARPRDGGHRVSRRRAAGPPRQDGPALLARDPDRPRRRHPRRGRRRGASPARAPCSGGDGCRARRRCLRA